MPKIDFSAQNTSPIPLGKIGENLWKWQSIEVPLRFSTQKTQNMVPFDVKLPFKTCISVNTFLFLNDVAISKVSVHINGSGNTISKYLEKCCHSARNEFSECKSYVLSCLFQSVLSFLLNTYLKEEYEKDSRHFWTKIQLVSIYLIPHLFAFQ